MGASANVLLLVAFNGRSVAGVSLFRVFTEFAQGAALPEQVPALVQSDFEPFQASALIVTQLVLGVLPELALFVYQRLDFLKNLLIVHRYLPLSVLIGNPREATRGLCAGSCGIGDLFLGDPPAYAHHLPTECFQRLFNLRIRWTPAFVECLP